MYRYVTVVGVNIKGKWFYHQMMKKQLILLKNIPNSRLECTNHTLFQTKTAKQNHALWRGSRGGLQGFKSEVGYQIFDQV